MGLRRLVKVMRGSTLVPTPTLPPAGSVKLTVGCVRSKVGPVVKVLVTVPVIRLPAVSFTPVMVMV